MAKVSRNRQGRIDKRKAMDAKEKSAARKQSGLTRKEFRQGDRKAKVQSRVAEKLEKVNQNVNSVADYNYDAHKEGEVNQAELKAMRRDGISREEIQQSVTDSGLDVGDKAQKRLDRWLARGGKNPEDPTDPIDPIDPVDPVDPVDTGRSY